MTGFDSEADRRDAIRKQIVDKCETDVMNTILKYCVLSTQEERNYLQVAVIHRLMQGVCLEALGMMLRQEIHTAMQRIEDDDVPQRPTS